MIALDTNILAYSVQSGDGRQRKAIELIARAATVDSIISTQILCEFVNAARKRKLIDQASVIERIAQWSSVFRTVGTTPADVIAGARLATRFQFQ